MRFASLLVAFTPVMVSSSVFADPVAAPESLTQSAPRWLRGTAVQLMVTKEINSRTAKSGDRAKLRVNTPVMVDGQVAIPIGANAWAEIISAEGTKAAGHAGQLSIRLLYVETRWGNVELSGTRGTEGASNTGGVVMSVLGFGILGLLAKGNNATFKAGELINGYMTNGVTSVEPPLLVNVPTAP